MSAGTEMVKGSVEVRTSQAYGDIRARQVLRRRTPTVDDDCTRGFRKGQVCQAVDGYYRADSVEAGAAVWERVNPS